MRIRPIKITIKSREQVLKEAGEAFTAIIEGTKYEKHEEISFDNLETLRRALTPKRLEILHIIKQRNPESIYELAHIVQRDAKWRLQFNMGILAETVLYQLPSCPYCRKVREVLEQKKIPYTTLNVAPNRSDILRQKLKEKSGVETVPVLKIDGKYIGESEAIITYLNQKFSKSI